MNWRRVAGTVARGVGLLLLAGNGFMYLRYFGDPPNSRVSELQSVAGPLNTVWRLGLYGSRFTFLLALFGKGWLRGAGTAVSAATFLVCLMLLGAACGPFAC